MFAVLAALPAGAFELEMGAVTLNDTFTVPSWTSVTFLDPFDVPPLVFALPTDDGGDPATIRIRNVTATGFELLQVEPSANDGPHVAMPTAYLAIEAGDHLLPDGSRLLAFEHSTTSFVNRLISTSWDSRVFPSSFSAPPAVIAAIQTANNESGSPPSTTSAPFMDVGIRNVTSGSLQVSLERAESTAGTVSSPERIALLAADRGFSLTFVDQFGSSINLQSLATPTNIQGWDNGCFSNPFPVSFSTVPLAVASANTRNGNNGGWVRRCSISSSSLGLTIDEDIDNDSERSHIGESAGIIAASAAFHANFAVELGVVKDVATVSDPINLGTDPKAIPAAVVNFTLSVENTGSLSPDTDSLIVVDTVPSELSLCVMPACLAGGPVILDATGSPVPPGVTIGAIEYSDDGGATWVYTPSPDGAGFDGNVDAVRVTLSGTLASISISGPPTFDLVFAARVN